MCFFTNYPLSPSFCVHTHFFIEIMRSIVLSAMKNNGKFIITFILLVSIYLLVSFYKVNLFFNHPRFNKTDDFFLFTIDCAVQYKYAKTISEGKKIPTIDYKIQWPEGLKVFPNLTLAMELCSGNLFRILKFFGLKVKFHVFLIYFISFFSSLTLFPFFFLAKSIWNNNLSSLISTLFYTFSVTSFSRTIGNYLNEDFAMPFFATFVFFCFQTIIEPYYYNNINFQKGLISSLKNISPFLLTSIFGIIFLLVWHFSQFIFFLITIFLVVEYYILENKAIPLLLLFLALLNIFASHFNPVIKEKNFAFSVPMVLIYSFLFSIFLPHFIYRVLKINLRKKLTLLLFVIFFVILIFLAIFSSKNTSEYSHVYDLFIDKIKFLGKKPNSPSLLSPHARILWTTPFTTPSFQEILLVLFPVYTLLIFPFFELLKNKFRKNANYKTHFIVFFTFSTLIFFLMVERLSIFFIFFVTLIIGGNINFIKSLLKVNVNYKNILITVVLSLMILFCFIYEIRRSLNFYKIFFFTRYSKAEDVVRWIDKNTSQNSSFLTDFPLSSIIYTYTDRAICIHPKFEAVDIREKYIKFLNALFEDEKNFYSLCKKWKVNYFIFYILYYYENTNESFRYLADKIDADISNSPAFKFNFNTYSKTLFKPVYINEHYKVFKILH